MSLSWIESGTDVELFGALRDAVDDFVEDFLFDVEPRAGAAALAVIEEDGAGGAGNGAVEIGVVENDVGRFAAEFERNLLQVAGRGLHDELADFGRAGEGDLVDVRMRGERGAGGFAVAGNDVHDAIGNAGFLNQFAEAERRERSLLGGLQHDRCSPSASAGPSFHAAISSGKFHGMIWPTTPTGSRTV